MRDDMEIHPETYSYLTPTPTQLENMKQARRALIMYSDVINELVPDGPDKTYLIRKLREVGMWVNVALTRHTDGSPRT